MAGLTKADIKKIKTVSAELLSELRAYLETVQDAFAKQSTSDGFRQKIYDFLYDDRTGLPADLYTEGDIDLVTNKLYRHFSNGEGRSASAFIWPNNHLTDQVVFPPPRFAANTDEFSW